MTQLMAVGVVVMGCFCCRLDATSAERNPERVGDPDAIRFDHQGNRGFRVFVDASQERTQAERFPVPAELRARHDRLNLAPMRVSGVKLPITEADGGFIAPIELPEPDDVKDPVDGDIPGVDHEPQLVVANMRRPNVLFLAIDDLNDWIGALGGHPQAKTPNLDRLLEKSTVFHNAHCAAPVCSASRHALFSGLRPSTTGWYSNSSKGLKSYLRTLGETVPMPNHFRNNGYKTMAAGKIFHKGTSDIKGYKYWDLERPKFRWPKAIAARGHGYQGISGGHFHPFPRDGGAIYQQYQKGVSGQSLCWGALQEADIPDEGMPDEQIAAWAVEQLKIEHEKPFFLAVGFIRPHVPYTAPSKYFDLYPLESIIMPQVPADEMDDVPLWGKAMAYGTIAGGDHFNVQSVGEGYWRELVRGYLACVSFVDAQAGKVLNALDQGPNADNTIVVFWSDHGQHLGEKRHWRKMALWEESTRVPLAVRLPDLIRGGARCESAVSLLDLYPTMIDLCALPPVQGLEGVSLMPQLGRPDALRREPVVTTWQYNNHAVRDRNFRFIRYRDGSEELYDHRMDPGEHRNLAMNPDFAAIKRRLATAIPRVNVVPESIEEGDTDSYGRRYEMLRDKGIPDWLGKLPENGEVVRQRLLGDQ